MIYEKNWNNIFSSFYRMNTIFNASNIVMRIILVWGFHLDFLLPGDASVLYAGIMRKIIFLSCSWVGLANYANMSDDYWARQFVSDTIVSLKSEMDGKEWWLNGKTLMFWYQKEPSYHSRSLDLNFEHSVDLVGCFSRNFHETLRLEHQNLKNTAMIPFQSYHKLLEAICNASQCATTSKLD